MKVNNFLITWDELNTMGFPLISGSAPTGDKEVTKGEVNTYYRVDTAVVPYSNYINDRCPRYQDLIPVCSSCDTGYTWTQYDSSSCFRITLTGATSPSSSISLSGKTASEYGDFGSQFYGTGYNVDGTGTVLHTSLTETIWRRGQPSGQNGPLNRCSLWVSPYTDTPYNTWLGFSQCLSGLTVDKTYYVGIGGDNNFRLSLDGNEILNTIGGSLDGSANAFKYWHVYPIVIGGGNHILELFGENNASLAGFGCEIYDNTLNELTGFTTYSQLNIIFTSSGQTLATIVQDLSGNYISSGYTCPSGYTYSQCDGNCVEYVFCSSPSPSPYDIWIFNCSGASYASSAAALGCGSTGGPARYASNTGTIITGVTTFYTDTALTTPWTSGGSLWYNLKLDGAGTPYAVQINASGVAIDYTT